MGMKQGEYVLYCFALFDACMSTASAVSSILQKSSCAMKCQWVPWTSLLWSFSRWLCSLLTYYLKTNALRIIEWSAFTLFATSQTNTASAPRAVLECIRTSFKGTADKTEEVCLTSTSRIAVLWWNGLWRPIRDGDFPHRRWSTSVRAGIWRSTAICTGYSCRSTQPLHIRSG